MDKIKPDIIALSEVNLKEEQINNLNIEGYSNRAYFLRKNTTGGGVMILALNTITSKPVTIPSVVGISAEREFECCLTEFHIQDFYFILVCLYRTPCHSFIQPFLDKLECLTYELCKRYNNVILTGDININVLNKDSTYKKFKNILKMCNMSYKVDFPTRVTSTSKSAIDNFITNISTHKLETRGLLTGIFDHDAQCLDILNINSKHRNKIRKEGRIFSEANINNLVRHLSNESWMEVYQAAVEEKFNNFDSLFIYYFDLCLPKVFISDKALQNRPKWITCELKNLKSEVINLERLFRMTKDKTVKKTIKEKKVNS